MKTCIFCNEQKEDKDFNIEHIIPEALGNKSLIIKSVCKVCNSKLGSKVDSEVTDGFIAQIHREKYELKGYKSEAPYPFKGMTAIGDDGREMVVDKNLKPAYKHPDVSSESKNGKKIIHIQANTFDEAERITEKIIARENTKQSKEEILKNAEIVKKEHPEMKFTTSFNTDKLYIEAIKIAYEYMYYKFGESYLKGQVAQQLRKLVFDYINEEIAPDFSGIIGNTPKEFAAILNNLSESLKQVAGDLFHHFICLVINKRESIIFMKIEGSLMDFAVRVCDNTDKEIIEDEIIISIGYPSGKIEELK